MLQMVDTQIKSKSSRKKSDLLQETTKLQRES